MKNIALPFLTLMIGLVLGSWGPRTELRSAKSEISKLKTEIKDKTSRPLVTDVTKMLGVTSNRTATGPAPASTNTSDPNIESPSEANTVEAEIPQLEITPNTENIHEAIQAAQDMWKIRSTQAKQLLIENLNLTEDEAKQFDAITASMNDKLRKEIEQTVDTLKSQEVLLPENGLTLVNHISGILLDTYQEADQHFPEGWRDNMTEDTELLNFIDPSVALPLLDLEDLPESEFQ